MCARKPYFTATADGARMGIDHFAAHQLRFAKCAAARLWHHENALVGEHIQRMPPESTRINGAFGGSQSHDFGTSHRLAKFRDERLGDVAHRQPPWGGHHRRLCDGEAWA